VRKLVLFVALSGGIVALLFVAAQRFGWPWPTSRLTEEGSQTYSSDALADYIPADAGAVLSFDVRQLREAPLVRGPLGEPLHQLVSRSEWELPWVKLAGIDPWDGVDRVRILMPAAEPSRSLWLIHGRIDPSRFQLGSDQFQPHREGSWQLYEFLDPFMGRIWLAAAGDTLLVSVSKSRLTETLTLAASPHPVAVRDAALRELLNRIDRTQPVWFVASMAALGSVARLQNRAMDAVLGPVLRRSRTIEGGVRVTEDVQAMFSFHTDDEAAAQQLQQTLKNVVEVAQGAKWLLRSDQDLLPLFDLIGTGETSRTGATVKIHCRMSSEQLR
jgi:hypothetical protein